MCQQLSRRGGLQGLCQQQECGGPDVMREHYQEIVTCVLQTSCLA